MNNKNDKSSHGWRQDPDLQRLSKCLTELLETFEITSGDVNTILKKLEKVPHNQFWRRLYVRTLFSHIEGICFRLKEMAYLWHEKGEKRLSKAEIAMILEESYYLTEIGKAKTRPNYQEQVRNLRFAFEVVARIFNIDYKLEVGTEDWKFYLHSLKIRNRITHPKNSSDLNITNEELSIITKVSNWFGRTTVKLFSELERSTRDIANKLTLYTKKEVNHDKTKKR